MSRDELRMDENSIRGMCTDLFRNLWMVAMTAIAVWMAVTGWHNLTYKAEYTASATLVVTVKGESNIYSALTLTTQMADVFGQVFQSDALRDKISEETGEDIRARIECTAIEETNLLALRTTCSDPRQAYIFINSALKHYEEVAGEVFSNASLQIVQEPDVPSLPSNTSWVLKYRYLITAAGALGMALLICLFYVLRFTVKTPLCAERQLDGRIRGVIPYEKKGIALRHAKNPKQALLLNSPLVSMDFAEATRRIETKIEYHMRRRGQKVILVTSIAENEGKSTVAANLAIAMGEKHKKVLLVDGDLRLPAQHKVFEKKGEKRSLSDILNGECGWEEAVEYNQDSRIWEAFQFRPVPDPADVLKEQKIEETLESWKREMDYIIIDCSPVSVSADVEMWVSAVDTVLLVVREDWSDVRVINDAVDIIWQSGKDFAGFVLNSFHAEWGHADREYRHSGYGAYKKAYGRRQLAGDESAEENR